MGIFVADAQKKKKKKFTQREKETGKIGWCALLLQYAKTAKDPHYTVSTEEMVR